MITVLAPGLKDAEFQHVEAAMTFAKARGGTLNFQHSPGMLGEALLRKAGFRPVGPRAWSYV